MFQLIKVITALQEYDMSISFDDYDSMYAWAKAHYPSLTALRYNKR